MLKNEIKEEEQEQEEKQEEESVQEKTRQQQSTVEDVDEQPEQQTTEEIKKVEQKTEEQQVIEQQEHIEEVKEPEQQIIEQEEKQEVIEQQQEIQQQEEIIQEQPQQEQEQKVEEQQQPEEQQEQKIEQEQEQNNDSQVIIQEEVKQDIKQQQQQQFLKNNIKLIEQIRDNQIQIPIIKVNKEKENVKICSLNATTLNSTQTNEKKISKIYNFINDQNVDVLCIQETKGNVYQNFHEQYKDLFEDNQNILNKYISYYNIRSQQDKEKFFGVLISVKKDQIEIEPSLNIKLNSENQVLNEILKIYSIQGRLMFLLYQVNNQNLLIINLYQKFGNDWNSQKLRLDFIELLPNIIQQIKQKLIDEKKIKQQQEFKVILCGDMNQKDLITFPNADSYEKNLDENNNEKWKYLTNTYYLSNGLDKNKFKKDLSDYQNQQEKIIQFQTYIKDIKKEMIDYIFIDKYQDLHVDWQLYSACDLKINNSKKTNHNFMVVNLTFNNKQHTIDQNGDTIAMVLASKKIIPPKQFQHDPNIQNNNGKTVQDYLIENNIIIPSHWLIKNEQITIDNKIEQLLKEYCQQFNINNKQTVINYPAFQRIIGNQTSLTFAMWLADKGIIPHQYWQHDSDLRSNNGMTVAMYLAQNQKFIPEQWEHDPNIKNNDGFTVAMILARQGITPTQQWVGNQNTIYEYKINDTIVKRSIGHELAYHGIIPIKSQKYSVYLIDDKNNTIYDVLKLNKSLKEDQFQQWKYDNNILNKLKEFTENNYELLNQIINNPQYQEQKNNMTFAMHLAKQGIDIPEEFQHDPNIKDQYGNTVALLLAQNKIIPPQQWYHNPYITNQIEKTIQDYLKENNIDDIPKQWQTQDNIKQELKKYCDEYDINKDDIINNPSWQNNNQQTFAMWLAEQGIIPPKEFEHDPELQDSQGNTVAVYLEINEIETPEQWQYESDYILKYGMTTAMKIVDKGYIPSDYWYHDADLEDEQGRTVQDYFVEHNMEVPEKWFIEQEYYSNEDDEYNTSYTSL